MRRKRRGHVSGFGLLCLVLVACLDAPMAVRADEPPLSFQLAGGGRVAYPISLVHRVVFDVDTLVVVWTGGTDRLGVDSMTGAGFVWNPADVSDPPATAGLMNGIHLLQNRPNPFTPDTQIVFELPRAGPAEMRIYGADGRLIRTLVRDALDAGRHAVWWNGRDEAGKLVCGGVYFYQLIAPGVEQSRQMILLP